MIKLLIHKALGAFGLDVRRTGSTSVPAYTVSAQALRRLVFFRDLMSRLNHVEGDIVECGVGTGKTLFTLSLLSTLFDMDRHIYGFDSFEGLPEPSRKDAYDVYNPRQASKNFACHKDEVIERLLRSGMAHNFISNNITLVQGWFADTLANYSGDGIALLHLDVDLYQSYKETLASLYPKVVKGGVIVFDEYRDPLWVGATRAIDEWFEDREAIRKSPIFDNKMSAPISTRYAIPTCKNQSPTNNSRYWENEKALYYVVKE